MLTHRVTSTVHPYDRTIDERGVGAGEKRSDARDVVCGSNVSNRDRKVALQNVRFDLVPAVAPASCFRFCVKHRSTSGVRMRPAAMALTVTPLPASACISSL
jgi:hypothetical protein